jgi:hypothetical protein
VALISTSEIRIKQVFYSSIYFSICVLKESGLCYQMYSKNVFLRRKITNCTRFFFKSVVFSVFAFSIANDRRKKLTKNFVDQKCILRKLFFDNYKTLLTKDLKINTFSKICLFFKFAKRKLDHFMILTKSFFNSDLILNLSSCRCEMLKNCERLKIRMKLHIYGYTTLAEKFFYT